MITVKLIGGAKKSFSKDNILVEKKQITIEQLLDYLLDIKPEGTLDLDVNNVLVAVNGIDSSALNGKKTLVKENDIVSIIPIIHGGTSKRIQITIGKNIIEIFEIKNYNKFNDEFLTILRKNYPKITIQGISSKYIISLSHIKKILQISLKSQKNQILLSEKIETDILLRFSATTQISEAIKKVGIKSQDDFFLIAISSKKNFDKLYLELKPNLKPKMFAKNNSSFLKDEFNITNAHLKSILSNTPLEDILVEKAAVLF